MDDDESDHLAIGTLLITLATNTSLAGSLTESVRMAIVSSQQPRQKAQILLDALSNPVHERDFINHLENREDCKEQQALCNILNARRNRLDLKGVTKLWEANHELSIFIGIIPQGETALEHILKAECMGQTEKKLFRAAITEYGILIKRFTHSILTVHLLHPAHIEVLVTNISEGTFATFLLGHIQEIDVQHQRFQGVNLTARLDDASEQRLKALMMEDTVQKQKTSPPADKTLRKLEVLWTIFENIIKSNQPLAKFYNLLMKYKKDPDLLRIRSPVGLPLLHECVYNKRADLLIAFVYSSLWTESYSLKVTKSGSPLAGCDIIELAKNTSNSAIQHELERLNDINFIINRHPLMMATLEGDVEQLTFLLINNTKGITTVAEQLTCLDLAIGSGDLGMVEFVWKAEKRAKFHRRQLDEQLRLCVELGQCEIIKFLHSMHKLNANIEASGRLLMERAATIGDVNTFETLLSIGGHFPITGLSLAATHGQADLVRACLTMFRDNVDVSYQDKRQRLAIQFAIEKGHLKIINMLLKEQFNVRHIDMRGRTIFHSSAECPNVETIKLVMEKTRGKVDVQQLLQQPDRYLGSELCFLVRGQTDSHSAWHYVQVDRALLHIFKSVLRQGTVDVAEYGVTMESGWGAQPPAEKVTEVESRFDMLSLTEDSPADMTPLHVAILKDHEEVALYLIELMEDINVVDHFKLTPLHIACMRGNLQIIKGLEAKGARWEMVDTKGRTPIEIAKLNKHKHILQYVQSGELHRAAQTFVNIHITPTIDKLSVAEIEKKQDEGRNVNDIIKEALRDLEGEVSAFMYDHLQTGPITTATDNSILYNMEVN